MMAIAVLLSKDGVGELPIPSDMPVVKMPKKMGKMSIWTSEPPTHLDWPLHREFWRMPHHPRTDFAGSLIFYEER